MSWLAPGDPTSTSWMSSPPRSGTTAGSARSHPWRAPSATPCRSPGRTRSTPSPPQLDIDPDAIARGEALFNSRDAGCAGCHTPPLYTDNGSYDLLGDGEMSVPTLRGIGATPPYLHDGSRETLFDVLDWADGAGMGQTAHLDDGERSDLVAFLQSLWVRPDPLQRGDRCPERVGCWAPWRSRSWASGPRC